MPFQRLHTIATAIVARKFVEAIGDGRCIYCRDVATTIAHIVRRWRGVEIKLAIKEEKQLVFDYRTTERHTINLCLLLGKFCSVQRTATIEIIVVIVGVCRTRKGVCTRLGDGIYTSATETALAHIERCCYDLNIRDSIKRNGVSTCQTSVCTRRGQAVHIVRCSTVNLEGVITRVRTGDGYSAIFRHHSLRSKAGNVIYRARYGRRSLNDIAVENLACAHSARIELISRNHNSINSLRIG